MCFDTLTWSYRRKSTRDGPTPKSRPSSLLPHAKMTSGRCFFIGQRINLPRLHGASDVLEQTNRLKEPFSSCKNSSWDMKFRLVWVEMRLHRKSCQWSQKTKPDDFSHYTLYEKSNQTSWLTFISCSSCRWKLIISSVWAILEPNNQTYLQAVQHGFHYCSQISGVPFMHPDCR